MKPRKLLPEPGPHVCPACGVTFSRPSTTPRTVFATQKYCSRPCASRVLATTGHAARIIPSPAERLAEHYIPEPNSGCWLWIGALNGTGYGRFQHNGKIAMAHRASYEIHVGPIPAGMQANHKCDTPLCVNPQHIWLGTQAENMEDCRAKGRMPLGKERWATKLTADQALDLYKRVLAGESLAAAGRRYGVRWQTVQSIRNGYSWAHVTGARG